MGIDPVTHKPFSHLMAEIATTLAPPQAAHLAEAALGCFKDEVLHLLTKKPTNFQVQHSIPAMGNNNITAYINCKPEEKDENAIEEIKLGLSKAMQESEMIPSSKSWDPVGIPSTSFAGSCSVFPTTPSGFQFSPTDFGNEGDDGSVWSQSVCTGSTCTGMVDQQGQLGGKLEDENGEDDSEGGKEIRNGTSSIFNSDCVLWDLPSHDR